MHTLETDIKLVKRIAQGYGAQTTEERERLAVLVASGLVLPGGVNRVPVEHIEALNASITGAPPCDKHSRLVARIIRLIGKAGGEIAHSKLINAVKVPRAELDKALTAAGVIAKTTQPERGRPKTTYRLV